MRAFLLLLGLLCVLIAVHADIAGDVLSAMDMTANPCDDFYQYACGGWLRDTVIPSDSNRVVRSFSTIEKANLVVLKDILTQKKDGSDPALDKILDFYNSCMDTDTIEKLGLARVLPLFSQIAKQVDRGYSGITAAIALLHSFRIPVFFNFYVNIDAGNPGIKVGEFGQAGINLPRGVYLATDPESVELINSYTEHISNMLMLIGESPAEAQENARMIVAMEKQLAAFSWSAVDMRDPVSVYNKIDIVGLESIAPQFPWRMYLESLGFPTVSQAIVLQPSFFTAFAEYFSALPQKAFLEYFRWHLIHATAPLLSKRFVDEDFAFFGAILQGKQAQSPRDTTCVSATDDALGFILGRFYVDRKFSGDSKTIALDMIAAIERAFHNNLETLEWMDDATRAQANVKLTQVTNFVGYPAVWDNYTEVLVSPSEFFTNAMTARQYGFIKNMQEYGKPVDKNLWEMTPSTVNAYYEPTKNEMVFPAGILQNPFFDIAFPEAMRYGGAGFVMGHELTHGFDDEGRQYNGQGKLQEWWTAATAKQFTERAQCISKQYSRYSPLPGHYVNGNLTLGENIADNGGVKEAFIALKDTIGETTGNSPSIVSGLTNFQLFFVSAAQVWCAKETDASIKNRLLTDPHSPPKFRVIGPLSNSDDFAATFQCPVGSPMNPKEKCSLW